MERNHCLWHCLYRKKQHSACCIERRVLKVLCLGRVIGVLGQVQGNKRVLPQQKPSWSWVRHSCGGDTSIGPLVFTKCKYQTSNPFPFDSHSPEVLNLIQIVETDSFILRVLDLRMVHSLWHWSVRIWPYGCRKGWWVLTDWAPFSSLTAGSLYHVHKECIHSWMTSQCWLGENRKAGMPGSTWLPGSFLPQQQQGQM